MERPRAHVTVLIPAAGTGSRLGGPRKQYRRLGEESLLVRATRLFERHARTSSIVVAVPPPDVSSIVQQLMALDLHKVHRVVPGGENRQASVAAAFDAAPEDTEILLVHDAARPFLPPDLIDIVIDAIEQYGAAAPALPVSDTLRRADLAWFGETVAREGVSRMQTPQGARKDWFGEAYAAARRDDFVATDEVALLKRAGRSVRVVPGSTLNFKVTTPEDWLLAQALWHHLATTV